MPLRADLGAAVVSLAVLLVVTVLAAGRPRRWTAVLWAAAALLWLWVDRPFEIAVLVELTPRNGVTVGDLLAPATGLVVLAGWLRHRAVTHVRARPGRAPTRR